MKTKPSKPNVLDDSDSSLVEVFRMLDHEEAKAGLTLARKHKVEVEFLLKVSEVSARMQRIDGSVTCYVWPQAAFEVGLNYTEGRKLTKEDVISRLAETRKLLKRRTIYNKAYWKSERELCKKLLASWPFKS